MKNKARYIKHVELISENEFKKIGVFQSLLSRFNEHSDVKGRDTSGLRMVLSNQDGELREVEIDELVCRKNDFMDSFSDGRTFLAVKMLWSDGKWEYGLKMWESKDRTYSKNRKLMPLYAKVGVVNEETGEIEDVFNYDKESRVPAWILELIPMWNEKVRDAIYREDKDALKNTCATYKDWVHVRDVMYSTYINTSAHWKEVKIGKTKTKMAISVEFDKNRWWQPVMTTWKDKVCREEFGAIADMLEKDAIKVFCYSYVKSLYCDHSKRVKEYKVIPLSDILLVRRHRWNGEKHEYDCEEVWNSLDEACKGNV